MPIENFYDAKVNNSSITSYHILKAFLYHICGRLKGKNIKYYKKTYKMIKQFRQKSN